MEEKDGSCFDYDADARMCSLTSSGSSHDSELADKLSQGSQFYCLTCGNPAEDRERLCSPALL